MLKDSFEKKLIYHIQNETKKGNKDNISRTKCYESFYFRYPEIQWSLLAGFVSRNAGWHMCDLEGILFTKIFSKNFRRAIFTIYEKANWLIFQDVYPQLLLYHYSTVINKPLFHLLPYFSVSRFMQREWLRFWEKRDKQRLLYALIINEQNLIQEPIINNQENQRLVFQSIPYQFQDRFSYSFVLLPTLEGILYGCPVKKFTDLHERIELGKRLALILFSQNLQQKFLDFAKSVEPTGSRMDFAQFMNGIIKLKTPILRLTYPMVDHPSVQFRSWDSYRPVQNRWFAKPAMKRIGPVTEKYVKKQRKIAYMTFIKDLAFS